MKERCDFWTFVSVIESQWGRGFAKCCMEITSWPLQPNRTKLDCMRLAFVSTRSPRPPLSAGSPHPEYPPFSLPHLIYITWLWWRANFGQQKRLTKAVQTTLYELIQADSAGAGGRPGVLQGPTDVLGTGTCIPSSLDQLGLPKRERERNGRQMRDLERVRGGRETSRAACGEKMQVNFWGIAVPNIW